MFALKLLANMLCILLRIYSSYLSNFYDHLYEKSIAAVRIFQTSTLYNWFSMNEQKVVFTHHH